MTWTAGDRIVPPVWVQKKKEDRAAPQGPSLRDTQYVHEAYVTMYIAKERNKSIAQVGILANALLVQYICWIWFNNQ